MAIATRPVLAYEVEPWERYWPDVQPLWLQHWREVGLDHGAVPLDPDMAKYQAYADAGILFILTVRTVPDAELVGYLTAILVGHLHYKSTLYAIGDLFYLAPACRRGFAGVRLFREAERHFRRLGVKKVQMGTKLHDGLDVSRLLERLGYRHTDKLYCKVLED